LLGFAKEKKVQKKSLFRQKPPVFSLGVRGCLAGEDREVI